MLLVSKLKCCLKYYLALNVVDVCFSVSGYVFLNGNTNSVEVIFGYDKIPALGQVHSCFYVMN